MTEPDQTHPIVDTSSAPTPDVPQPSEPVKDVTNEPQLQPA